ncbi:hypothetical protein, partial [Vibrio navarrensis]|uniref:hypothetical protein n=1 Tax=Vibrio navarrensis TaxID=29495 RepID=UPI0029BFD1A3
GVSLKQIKSIVCSLFFLPLAIRSGFSANRHCLPMQVLSSCLNEVLGLLKVSQLGAKSLLKFAVRFEFSENDLSKFTGFQST